MMADDTRLFFDVSSLLNHIRHANHYTGIQRVVSMLVTEIANIHTPSKVYVTFLDRKDKKHKCISLEKLGSETLRSPTLLKEAFFSETKVETSDLILQRFKSNPLKVQFYKIRLDLFAKRGNNRKLKRFGLTANDWIRIREDEKAPLKAKKPRFQIVSDVMRAGDKLILLDSTWDERYFESFKGARDLGCHVYTLVHDLIPIISAEGTPGFLPLEFKKWLSSSLDFTDTYLTVSNATRQDLEVFLNYSEVQKDVQVLPLAQDRFGNGMSAFPACEAEGQNVQKVLPERLEKLPDLSKIIHLSDATREALSSPFVLCVGTIEPRKNVWRLALAWKHLIDQGHVDLPRLVLAGKEGAMVQSLKDLLHATGNINGYVSLLESPSEEALCRLYENCLFLVMPSLFEGWGLPVGEALSFGKTAVVSEASSLPEVGDDMVEYCDPTSVDSIANAVLRLVSNPNRRKELEAKIRKTELRSWHRVALDLHEMTVRQGTSASSVDSNFEQRAQL